MDIWVREPGPVRTDPGDVAATTQQDVTLTCRHVGDTVHAIQPTRKGGSVPAPSRAARWHRLILVASLLISTVASLVDVTTAAAARYCWPAVTIPAVTIPAVTIPAVTIPPVTI